MSWNVELARIGKDITFDAGLLVIILGLTFVSLFGPKKPYFKFAVAFLLLVLFSIRGGEELISVSLDNYAQDAKQLTLKNKCWYRTEPVVVLGSGLYSHELPSTTSQNRILAALEINQNYSFENKQHLYFFSGGVDPRFQISEASVMAKYFKILGGTSTQNVKIFTEEKSANTYENALYIDALFKSYHLPKSIILVTSGFHFLRASATFEKFGFKVCNWPVSAPDLQTTGIFNYSNAEKFSRVLNEYFGIFGYWFRGWL